MSQIKLVFGIAVIAGLLFACVQPELNDARNAPSAKSQYFKHLQTGYLELAEDEYAEDDWVDTRHFAKLASAAAASQSFGPQDIAARELPKDKVAEMSGARSRLLAAFNSGGRIKAPKDAAEAQVMFDCWMQEQEENFQPDDIRKCRERFNTVLASLEGALKPMARARAPVKPPQIVKKPQSITFVVYFGFDKAGNSNRIKKNVAEVIKAAKTFAPARIQVAGHTDRVGRKAYNLKLSKRRANTVARQLVATGLSSKAISVNGFGESMQAVHTRDGKRLRENRRVVITLLK